jgi:hypothetical protein
MVRARTAYPCSLRVITQVLQGCAEDCKSRIFRGVSFLRVAACCTLLRSRWYQSGVRSRSLSLVLSTRVLLSLSALLIVYLSPSFALRRHRGVERRGDYRSDRIGLMQ